MSALGDARRRLVEALAPVLPGRVSPYPLPRLARGVAPYVYVEQPEWSLDVVGERTTVVVVGFPVWVLYDGAVEAQVAGLDDLVSKLWDACLAVERARPIGARTDSYRTGDGELRATVIEVETTLTALTFCPPTVAPAAEVPPERVLVPT